MEEDKIQQQKSYRKVIEYIKEQIKEGKLQLGGKLPTERDLSNLLGVSRNSVREAIRTMDIMGVISSQQGAGNYLTGNFGNNLVESMSMMFLLGQVTYQQISQLRRALELQALILAIDNITEPELEQLKKISAQMETETEEINVILDKQLHYSIALASGNTIIIDILQALSDLIDRFILDLRRDIRRSEDNRAILDEAHHDMLRSIITKDKNLAYEAISKHFDIVDIKLKDKEEA